MYKNQAVWYSISYRLTFEIKRDPSKRPVFVHQYIYHGDRDHNVIDIFTRPINLKVTIVT